MINTVKDEHDDDEQDEDEYDDGEWYDDCHDDYFHDDDFHEEHHNEVDEFQDVGDLNMIDSFLHEPIGHGNVHQTLLSV